MRGKCLSDLNKGVERALESLLVGTPGLFAVGKAWSAERP